MSEAYALVFRQSDRGRWSMVVTCRFCLVDDDTTAYSWPRGINVHYRAHHPKAKPRDPFETDKKGVDPAILGSNVTDADGS